MRAYNLATCVMMACVWGASSFAQAAEHIQSPRHKAWDMLMTAAFSQRASERTDGVRALGLLRDNSQARQLAEYSLNDSNSDVRRAAATALGQMHAKESIP